MNKSKFIAFFASCVVFTLATPQNAAAAVATGAAAASSCYRALGAAVPSPRGMTIVLLDTTTPRDEIALSNFRDLVRRLLKHAGERVMVTSFAGLSAAEHPALLKTVQQEPRPDDAFRSSRVIEDAERLDACLPKLWASNIKTVDTLVSEQINDSVASGTYSEIAHALRWATSEVLPAVAASAYSGKGKPPVLRVLVYSDGLLHSRTGQSFYQQKNLRKIDPAKELALLKASGLDWPLGVVPLKFELYWVGLGVDSTGSKRFASPVEIDALRAFWISVGKAYGATRAQAGHSLPPEVLK